MGNPKILNFQGIHTIRLYLPPVINTIHHVVPPLSPYISSGKKSFLIEYNRLFICYIHMYEYMYLIFKMYEITPFGNKLPHGTPHH